MADNIDKSLESTIKAHAAELLKHLESGDEESLTKIRQAISKLNAIREESLYKEIGKLTRELHDTLKDIDVGEAAKEMPSVRSKLMHVMHLMEDAANKTMDGIEATIPIANNLAKEANGLLINWGKLRRREMGLEEFKDLYKHMMKFLESVEEKSALIHDKLQEVHVTQTYQDLAGQAINKVVNTVSDLEKKLLHLVLIASETTGEAKSAEILQTTSELNKSTESTKKSEVSGQDEVDDLLSSLGF